MLSKLLKQRFGKPADALVERLAGLDDAARLDAIADRLLTASSLAEVEAILDR